MDVSRMPLAQIRERIRSNPPASLEGRIYAALRRDVRHGAHLLADSMGLRIEARRAEARRMARLFSRRRRLLARGARWVAGIDEVGVGPLAGPVVAAAVVLPVRVDLPGLADSKQLGPLTRERLARGIRAQALAVAVAEVSPSEIDRMNILRASLEAMRRAVVALTLAPDHLLVDARTVPGVDVPQTSLIHGDAIDGSIAAASIVAKVYRDALMGELDARYPGYGFAKHKGYPTRKHLEALARLGPTPTHRRSFAPVAQTAGS